ncbi:MAG TPA: AraC family transcriptional regulator, partial [Clostridia bacterium]|nr:AraC family transcriptional regulator [Clostridia bacterium]
LTAQALIFKQIGEEGLQPILRDTLLTIEPAFGLEVTAYVGATVEGLSNVHDSYRVALRLSEQSAYSSIRAKVIVPGTAPAVAPGGEHNVYYPLNMEQALIQAVIHGRASVMRSTVHELIAANAGEHRGNLSTLSLMLTATVNRILDGVKRSATDIFEEDTIIYLEFRGCADYDALEKKAVELFSVLSDYLAAETKKSAETIEKKMTDFIAENFSRDISLHDLAGHVNLSKNYVSAQFKNATGQTFKDYLGELRHGKAKEILEQEPGVRIHEVAARVGCSPDTLLRLFMRYSGVSPSDYQQECQRRAGV